MRIPFVIDNRAGNTMAAVLTGILGQHTGKAVDVATAYFNVQGFNLLREGLERTGAFRLLIGAEPAIGRDVGLQQLSDHIARTMTGDLNLDAYDEVTLRAVEALAAFLKRPDVQVRSYSKGFLHAKTWIFHEDKPDADGNVGRMFPLYAIVGSSNFTRPGLTTNKELNLSHKVRFQKDDSDAVMSGALRREGIPDVTLSDLPKLGAVGQQAIVELDEWFERHWAESADFKTALIDLLNASKFGTYEYTPYQIYLKALFEYFKDDLEDTPTTGTTTAVDLSEFQADAVKKARRILTMYDGVIVADSVGLGKTWIGKRLLEDFAYHRRMKALVVCPANLRPMWTAELREASIPATILSQEELGRLDPDDPDDQFDIGPYEDVDVVLIDESHNFRSRGANRYANLTRILDARDRRGKSGERKKLILLTATPINNDLFDLYNQMVLFTGNDRGYFAGAGIGDLYKYFLRARKELSDSRPGEALYNLLEEVVIRRTRSFVRKAYPNATIRGQPIKWPERKLKTIRYNLEKTYAGIYEKIVEGVGNLTLPQYQPDHFLKKPPETEKDALEVGRQEGLVGIFKSRYLKRFESSVEAFRISVRRALDFVATYEDVLKKDGKLLNADTFHEAVRLLEEDDQELPESKYASFKDSEEIGTLLKSAEPLDEAKYDKDKILKALQSDYNILSGIWTRIEHITPQKDVKLQELKRLLSSKEFAERKLIVFSYYRDTARYVFDELTKDHQEGWYAKAGSPRIERMDSGDDLGTRSRKVARFAPDSSGKRGEVNPSDEIQIMVSTDVLSEGHNLQDCGLLLNYDLHWNPVRMIQRAGRIDRIGSKHHELTVANMFPDEGLEKLLKLMESLTNRIEGIDKAGFHDASILGEVPHPTVFNTLRRIRDADGSIIEEEEEASDLASNEALVAQLKEFLATHTRSQLESLPDGIHSKLDRAKQKGVFFYFTEGDGNAKRHFWRYYDAKSDRVIDNRYAIAQLIACKEETSRSGKDTDLQPRIFEIQQRVLDDIRRSQIAEQAVQAAPRPLDQSGIQNRLRTLLRDLASSPTVSRAVVKGLLERAGLPLSEIRLKQIKKAIEAFGSTKDSKGLIATLDGVLPASIPSAPTMAHATSGPSGAADSLRLMCFEFIVG
ncbi:MAG: helicase [Planctomycetes bacterium]|nr:helicase [Planctomycetota bacterium]MCW8137026.1 helicase [Planctomycetota bacterium]